MKTAQRIKSMTRSLIPDFFITDAPLPTDKPKKHKRKSKNKMSTAASNYYKTNNKPMSINSTTDYTDAYKIFDQSKVFDIQYKLLLLSIIIVLILAAMTPIMILLFKKNHWRWLGKLMFIKQPEIIETKVSPIIDTTTPVGVNTTGEGIDINKPFVIPKEVHTQYIKTMTDSLSNQ